MNTSALRFSLAASCMLVAGCMGSMDEDARPTGSACQWGLQCVGEWCIGDLLGGEPTGWTDGMCTSRCTDGQCPVGELCTDLKDGLYCLPGCQHLADCRSGYVCHSLLNVCFPDCHQTGCADGYGCSAAGECEFERPEVELAADSQPCGSHADCGSAWCVPEQNAGGPTGWSGGMCVSPCIDGACVPGFKCALIDQTPLCLPACEEDSACRSGYVCDSYWGVCLPDCTLGWDCGAGRLCAADGLCVSPPPDLAPLGAPCVDHVDCATGWCIPEKVDGVPTGFAGGACSLPCGAGCPPGSGCMVVPGQTFCLQSCFGGPMSGSCRSGYICDPDFHVCLPHCSNLGWKCGPNFVCAPSGVCVPPGGPGGGGG